MNLQEERDSETRVCSSQPAFLLTFLFPTEHGVNEVAYGVSFRVILSVGVSSYDNFLSLGFTGGALYPSQSQAQLILRLCVMYSWLQAVWEPGPQIGQRLQGLQVP